LRAMRGNIVSMLSGIGLAGALYAVLWQQVGAVYNSMYTDPTTCMIMLFGGCLMAGIIAIAVSAGLVVSFTEGSGRLKSAASRAAVAAMIFGVVALAALMLSNASDGTVGSTASSQSPGICLAALLAFLGAIAFVFFGAIFSLPYATFAAIGALVGELLHRRSKKMLIVAISFCSCIALSIALVQGAFLRPALREFDRVKPVVQAHISRELMNLPKEKRWRPRLVGDFRPRLRSISCKIADGGVTVDLGTKSVLQSVKVYLTMPQKVKLESKSEAVEFLRNHGIHDIRLVNLKKNKWGEWESVSGVYSVHLRPYRPPMD
jgi:hypothetical protein